MSYIDPTNHVQIGQFWMVADCQRWYPAEVLGFVGDRVQIRAVCPPNIRATPTLALRYRFNNRPDKGYWLIQEAPC